MRKKAAGAGGRAPRPGKGGKKEKKQARTALSLTVMLAQTRAAQRRLLALANRLDNAGRLLEAAISRGDGTGPAVRKTATRRAAGTASPRTRKVPTRRGAAKPRSAPSRPA